MPDPQSPLLSVPEVARMLGYSRGYTYSLAKASVFPSTRLTNGRIVVPRDAFESWLEDLNHQALASVVCR